MAKKQVWLNEQEVDLVYRTMSMAIDLINAEISCNSYMIRAFAFRWTRDELIRVRDYFRTDTPEDENAD